MMARFDTSEKVDAAFAELCNYWDNLLNIYTVNTGNDKLDRMVNIWNQYQCMVTFCMSRSASFFESGIGRGMGFRDSNQDLVGFVHLIPERARERIIDIASTQFPDGGCYHQYQPLTKRGNNDIGGGFNDDPAGSSSAPWPISKKRETSRFSTKWFRLTTNRAPRSRCLSTCKCHSTTWSITWGRTVCPSSAAPIGTTV